MSPSIWRLHIQQEENIKVEDRCRFCVDRAIAGIGWSVGSLDTDDWGEYCRRARESHPKFDSVKRLHDQVQIGDLVWTRDTQGQYWLGRISGSWAYRHTPEHVDADIHNFRSCDWHRIGELAEVPGRLRNAFIRGQALRRLDDATVRRFSMDLYNRRTGQSRYELREIEPDLYSLFDPDDCEDLVAVYLQRHGWVLYPGTCKKGTPKYEFIMRNAVNGNLAAVQVKQAGAEIAVPSYEDFDGEVFLFQTEGRYAGHPSRPSTKLLDPEVLRRFCVENARLMSPTIQLWIAWCVGAKEGR
jgi:hypothetical protein